MKPKIKKINGFLKLFLSDSIIGITLAPFGIYCNEKYMKNTKVINHELIHWHQQMELYILPFYIKYIGEWLRNRRINKKTAYKNISFEREAYANDDNLQYLNTRVKHAWKNYKL